MGAERSSLVLAVLLLAPIARAAPALEPQRHEGQSGSLSAGELALAKAAWRYFENNFQPTTCFYNAVDNYPSSTMWDVGSALAGITSAYELGLIADADFDRRVGCLLESLATLDLYRNGLPNKVYETVTLTKVNYGNEPGEIGVSAIDLGRLLTWLAIVKERYPQHGPAVDRFVLRWHFCELVTPGGTLYGAVNDGETGVTYLQEGRLGYEEYAAYGYQPWGFDTTEASLEAPSEQVGIYGVPITYDGRDPKQFDAHTYVVTEAWLLSGIEHGWARPGWALPGAVAERRKPDPTMRTLARRVYEAQYRRWRTTGVLTARTEHQVEAFPFFVYDTVFSDGVPWATISDDGSSWPGLAAVSTKAAIGLSVLFDTPYTDRLADAVSGLYDPDRGIYEGFYEADGRRIESFTVNTNGIVLETLLYKTRGVLYRGGEVHRVWDAAPIGQGAGDAQCFPGAGRRAASR